MFTIFAIWTGLSLLFLGIFFINNVEIAFDEREYKPCTKIKPSRKAPKQTSNIEYWFTYEGDKVKVHNTQKRDSKGRFA